MQATNSDFLRTIKSNSVLSGFIFLSALALGILAAYLVVNGAWHLALVALLALPAVVILHRYPWVGLIAWLLLEPFLLQTPTAAERQMYWVVHRAVPPLTVGILVVGSALQISRRRLPRLGLPELAMAGYLVTSLISIWTASDRPMAMSFLLYDRVFIPMCLYLIVRFTIQDGKSARRLLPVAVFLALSQSIIGILSWYLPHWLPAAWLTQVGSRTIGSLVNPSVYTTTLTFSSLLVLHAGLTSKSVSFRRIAILTFCLAGYSVFISFSRASWIGGIIVLVGLLFLYPRFILKTSLIVTAVIVLFGGWLLADQVQWAQARLSSVESERSALSRLPVYYASYRMFQSKPFLGWGYGNFDRFDRRYQERVAGLAIDDKDHASHNVYLTIIAEQGLIGLGLFLTPVIWLFVLSVRAFSGMPKNGFWSRKLLVILWLVIFSHIAVNNFSNMRVVYGLAMWWITLGLIASLIAAHPKPKPIQGVTPASGTIQRTRL